MKNWYRNLHPLTKATYITGLVGSIAIIIHDAKAIRKIEQEKRKKIREWELMNESALEASKKRFERLVNDPDSTAADLMVALKEEQEFWEVIGNQPMY